MATATSSNMTSKSLLAPTRPSSPFPLPASNPAFSTNHGGRFNGDAFVAKLGPGGTNVEYFTYLGGSGNESARDLVVDDSGHAFITGFTDSTNFPIAFTNTVFGITNHING